MPQMGVSVAEGTVVAWHKQPGDWVQSDEAIGEVSTDKIDTEIPSPASGRLVEILVQVGVTVDCGVTLARIATGDGAGDAQTPASFAPPPPAARLNPAAPDAAAAPATTRRSCSASPRSTTSTSTRSRAPAATAACASRM